MSASAPALPISIVILTKNEAARLPECLASVAGCVDVVVLDSGSTDETVALARAHGARVFMNAFVDFAQQRNHALEHLPFRHPWVFHLDADERMTPELLQECAAVAPLATVDGFYVAPRMLFHGTWLRRCTDYPAWQARLVHRERFRFVQAGHGQREAPGLHMGYLQGSYLHDISAPDEALWNAKHRRYAREEAEAYLRDPPPDFAALWRGPALPRRRALKRLSYALPFRPALRFLYQFLVRGGFLDGPGAWRYCRLLARYEGFATEALRQLQRKKRA